MKRITTFTGLLMACTLAMPATVFAQSGLNIAWEPRSPIPTGRAFAAASELDGKIYVMGGATSFYQATAATEMLDTDPAVDEWATLEEMPASLCAAASAVVDGKIYVFGGRPNYGSAIYLNSVYVYDPSGGGWSEFPVPMPTPRAFHTACVIGDSAVYLIGGRNLDAFSLTSVEKFVPKDSSWTTIDDLINPRSHPSAKVRKDKIYVMGGIDESGNPLSAVEIYDPSSDGNLWTQWSGSTPADVPRIFQGSGVYNDSLIFMFGGADDISTPAVVFSFYEFTPEYGFVKWNDAALPDTMVASSSTVSGDYQFGIGGVLLPFLAPIPGPPVSDRTWALHLINAVNELKPVPAWLSQNAPNPFATQTVIPYTLKKSSNVCIQVFDLNGRVVATLWNGYQGTGEYTAAWDASGMPAGVYLYQLKMDEGVLTRRCVLQKK
jgi:hypothetical protein